MEISVRSANVEKIFMGVSLLPVTDFYNELDLVSSFDYKKLIIVCKRCCCVYTCTKIKQYFITDGHIATNNENNLTTTLHYHAFRDEYLPLI